MSRSNKLILKRTYEDRISSTTPPGANFGDDGVRLHSILDFSNTIDGLRLDDGIFIIDLTMMWFNLAGLSSSGSIRCTALFTGRNLSTDAPGQIPPHDHTGWGPTSVDPGFTTPSMVLVEQSCVYWPSCQPTCFGHGLNAVFWYQNSKDPIIGGASVGVAMQGVETYNADNICFAIKRGDCAYQPGDQEFFTVVEAYEYGQ